jgi:hypothetical protein
MTRWIASDPLPVGVKLLQSADEWADVPVYRGVSYCDAVRRAGDGEMLRVLPGSIQVCPWVPAVLGLQEPRGRFERSLAPRLPFPIAGLLLAPVDQAPVVPDVVVARAALETLHDMVAGLGHEALWDGHLGNLDRSAIPLLTRPRATPRQGFISAVNNALAALTPSARWQALTHRLFRSGALSAAFEAVISRTMADMSVCRNSTAIPLLSGRVNISFFCTGGITWGRNRPDYLTSGWPVTHFRAATRTACEPVARRTDP